MSNYPQIPDPSGLTFDLSDDRHVDPITLEAPTFDLVSGTDLGPAGRALTYALATVAWTVAVALVLAFPALVIGLYRALL